jgi:hypothetical protein
MGEHQRRRFALECLLAAGMPAAAGDSENMPQPISVADELDTLAQAEQDSVERVQDITQTQEGVIALEHMALSLKRPSAQRLNRLAAQYFNLAAESFMDQARVPVTELPMDAQRIENEPALVVDEATAKINSAIQQAMTLTRNDLVNLMADLVSKRASMVRVIHDLHHRLSEIDEDLQAIEEGKLQPVQTEHEVIIGTNERYALMGYSGQGVVAKGATVAEDLIWLLTEHMSMYDRLTFGMAEWIRQHRDNIMNEYDKISEQYSFDPAQYLMAGMQFSHDCVGGQVYQTKPLPGGTRYYTVTRDARSFGYEGIKLLFTSTSYLAPDHTAEARNLPTANEVKALTVAELRARVKETRMALLKLREWCDCVHRDLWAKCMFSDAIVEFMITPAAVDDLNAQRAETFRRQAAAAVVKLLNEASASMGSQVLGVFQGMLRLLEDSMRAHVPHHQDVEAVA